MIVEVFFSMPPVRTGLVFPVRCVAVLSAFSVRRRAEFVGAAPVVGAFAAALDLLVAERPVAFAAALAAAFRPAASFVAPVGVVTRAAAGAAVARAELPDVRVDAVEISVVVVAFPSSFCRIWGRLRALLAPITRDMPVWVILSKKSRRR